MDTVDSIMRFFASLVASDEKLIANSNSATPIQRAYDFREVIGQGSFGIVRTCKHRMTHTMRACKSVRKQAPAHYSEEDKKEWKKAIQREVSNLQAVQPHPNLVNLVEVYEDATHVHLVMDKSQGGELYDLVLRWKSQKEFETKERAEVAVEVSSDNQTSTSSPSSSLPSSPPTRAAHEAETASIMYQIVDAVSYMHDVHSIVHRDLKASNFLFQLPKSMSPDQQLKVQIIDFGLSKHLPPCDFFPSTSSLIERPEKRNRSLLDTTNISESEQSTRPATSIKTAASGSSSGSHTSTSSAQDPAEGSSSSLLEETLSARTWYGRTTSEVGTPYYVAPEVLLADDYTCLCDVWSVGVIAYLLLSRGSLPFHGEDERATVKLLLQQDLQVAFPEEDWDEVSEGARDFCRQLLTRNPEDRPTAREALSHPWLVQFCGDPPPLLPRRVQSDLIIAKSSSSSSQKDENESVISTSRRSSSTWRNVFTKFVSSRNE